MSDQSWRYRFVSLVHKESRIDRSKACTFYWVLMPSALLGLMLGVVFMTIFFGIIVPLGWFFGFHLLPLNGDKHGQLEIAVRDDAMFFPRRYTARTNAYRRHSPLFYLVPTLVLGYLAWKVQSVGLEESTTASGNVAMDLIPVLAIVIAAALLLVAVGLVIAKTRGQLHGFWIRICPPLEVTHDSSTQQAS